MQGPPDACGLWGGDPASDAVMTRSWKASETLHTRRRNIARCLHVLRPPCGSHSLRRFTSLYSHTQRVTAVLKYPSGGSGPGHRCQYSPACIGSDGAFHGRDQDVGALHIYSRHSATLLQPTAFLSLSSPNLHPSPCLRKPTTSASSSMGTSLRHLRHPRLRPEKQSR